MTNKSSTGTSSKSSENVSRETFGAEGGVAGAGASASSAGMACVGSAAGASSAGTSSVAASGTGAAAVDARGAGGAACARGATAARTSRTHSIVLVGLTVAITAVSAWVTVPIGPVPFTLQMFAITFAICALTPKQAIASIFAYIALGAVGVPVFSGIRGGIGVLAGPTGGFLWGYLIGVPLAVLFLWAWRRFVTHNENARKNSIVSSVIAGVIFTAVAYICGCVQYLLVAGVTLEVALATCVLPFVAVDAIKIVLAAICANRVIAAVI